LSRLIRRYLRKQFGIALYDIFVLINIRISIRPRRISGDKFAKRETYSAGDQ
jgi:hypothetical protein